MFHSNSHRTINGLWENFGQLFQDEKSFKEYFQKNTKKKYTAILYQQKENKLKNNYQRYKAPDMKIYKKIKLNY